MSTGESRDQASLSVGEAAGNADEFIDDPTAAVSQGESADFAFLHVEPDRSEWVTCLPACHWADDGSGRDTGRSTPQPVHADGCPQSASPYVEFIPAPRR